MSVIPFIRRTSSERVDGTLTVKIDIEPQYRVQFIQMFPEIGSPGAIAALTQAASVQAAQEEAVKERPGQLCVMACNFCADKQFWKWISLHLNYDCINEDDAKDSILGICRIKSRKDLDTSKAAAEIFHTEIRNPYLAWRAA